MATLTLDKNTSYNSYVTRTITYTFSTSQRNPGGSSLTGCYAKLDISAISFSDGSGMGPYSSQTMYLWLAPTNNPNNGVYEQVSYTQAASASGSNSFGTSSSVRNRYYEQGSSAKDIWILVGRYVNGTAYVYNQAKITIPVKPSVTVTQHVQGQTTTVTLGLYDSFVRAPFPNTDSFTFKGWYGNSSATGTAYSVGEYIVTQSAEEWAIFNRTATLNANGGNAINPVTEIDTKALTLPSATRAGWRFLNWNTQSDGSGTTYTTSYPAYSYNVTLYAQWERWIDSVTINAVNAIRTSSSSSTSENDEGTYLYAQVPFTVKGAASASVSISASMTDQDGAYVDTFITGTDQSFSSHALTETLSNGKPETEADFTGTFYLRASGLDTDKTYTLTATVAATNTSATQSAVTDTKGALLTTAYFTMDLLGDSHYYVLTTDSSVQSGKTYYARGGTGTMEDPYTYTAVASPASEGLAQYYEATGERPGHGISFGAPATTEGFHVHMDADFNEDAIFLGDMKAGTTTANAKKVLPYLVFDTLAWTSSTVAQCSAAVADYRPCVARFSNGAVVEFDGDSQTDAYN